MINLVKCIWKAPITREFGRHPEIREIGHLTAEKCLKCNGYAIKCEDYVSKAEIHKYISENN